MPFKRIPNTDSHNCFACSPKNPHGLHMELYSDDLTVKSLIKIPEHFTGWGRVVHGGILSTILDEIMGWSGIYLLKQFTLTKNMNIDFIKAAFVGDTMEAIGRVTSSDGKRNAEIEGVITNSTGEICAKSKADFTMLSPKLAIRLGLVTAEQMRDFFEPLFNRSIYMD